MDNVFRFTGNVNHYRENVIDINARGSFVSEI